LNGVDDIVCTLRPLPTEPLSTRELASALECGMLLAQRTAHSAQRTAHSARPYCLQAVNIIEAAGKHGRAPLHRISSAADHPRTTVR
jgi:hypothetical protein